MIEAEITATQAGGKALRGVVGTTGAKLRVVAERDTLGEWRALYGLNEEGDQVELPSCFGLNPEALKALDESAALHEGAEVG